jgi:PAS domain S-box-containing protein
MDAPDVDQISALRGLVRALERYPSLFALSSDAVALYDRNGIIVAGNDAARALMGASLLGSHFDRHIAAEEIERTTSHAEAAFSTGPVQFDSIFMNRFGEPIKVAVRLIPVIIDGAIVGVFGVARARFRRGDATTSQFDEKLALAPEVPSALDP